jgi:hypothetical protein
MKRASRSAFSLVELAVAIVVITTMLVVTAQMMTLIANRLAANRRHLAAMETAANLMEQVHVIPFSELDQELTQHPAMKTLTKDLPQEWAVAVNVEAMEAPEKGQRIQISVTPSPHLPGSRPVTMTAWRHASGEVGP